MTLEAAVVRGDCVQTTKVSNLSLDGCGLSGDFAIGERVEIRIARLGQFTAQIRWSVNGHAGARFVTSSDPTVSAPASLLDADRGAAAIEYALLAALIAVALIAALASTGRGVGNSLNSSTTRMHNVLQVNTA